MSTGPIIIVTIALAASAEGCAAAPVAGHVMEPVREPAKEMVMKKRLRPELMDQGVQEPCVFCQVLYPEKLAAHCPHCNDRRIVFRPAQMMDRASAGEHVAKMSARCDDMEKTASPVELRECYISLLRNMLIYSVGDGKDIIGRIHRLDGVIGRRNPGSGE